MVFNIKWKNFQIDRDFLGISCTKKKTVLVFKLNKPQVN